MSGREFNTRIQHKHDSETNWNKATGFIPKVGELIIYDPDSVHTFSRVKVGDGETSVINLPFVGQEKTQVQILTWGADD
jgi:hypothetical protein